MEPSEWAARIAGRHQVGDTGPAGRRRRSTGTDRRRERGQRAAAAHQGHAAPGQVTDHPHVAAPELPRPQPDPAGASVRPGGSTTRPQRPSRRRSSTHRIRGDPSGVRPESRRTARPPGEACTVTPCETSATRNDGVPAAAVPGGRSADAARRPARSAVVRLGRVAGMRAGAVPVLHDRRGHRTHPRRQITPRIDPPAGFRSRASAPQLHASPAHVRDTVAAGAAAVRATRSAGCA